MKRRRNPTSSTIKKKKRNIQEDILLPDDVLQSIFQRLNLKYLANAKSVSSSWKYSAEKVNSNIHKAPWLILPANEEENFKNIEENIMYTMTKKTLNLLLKFPLIGSSHGWLILLDVSTFCPILFNPFTEDDPIKLPSVKSLFNISKIEQADEEGRQYTVRRERRKEALFKDSIRSFSMIFKAILTAVPEPELLADYNVVLIYMGPECSNNQIGFFKNGNKPWINLKSISYHDYRDIICFKNKLYALASYFYIDYSIHTWDLQNFSPKKVEVIKTSFSKQRVTSGFGRHGRCYLVESEGEIILVDKLCSGDETKLFKVYKLDSKQWIEVDSLGDRSLFIGGSHSVSISTKDFRTCKRNSIYFTDDYWDLTIGDSDFGWLDNGIFSLEDGSCSRTFEFDSENVRLLPCWIVPNQSK